MRPRPPPHAQTVQAAASHNQWNCTTPSRATISTVGLVSFAIETAPICIVAAITECVDDVVAKNALDCPSNRVRLDGHVPSKPRGLGRSAEASVSGGREDWSCRPERRALRPRQVGSTSHAWTSDVLPLTSRRA